MAGGRRRMLGAALLTAGAVLTGLATRAADHPEVGAATGGLGLARLPGAVDGNVQRGRALLVARENANCVLCHAVPDPVIAFAGDVGPSLAHVAARLSPAQIRLRIVDNARVNPRTIMPSYFRTEGLDRVATAYRGRTILSAQEVEDLVAYLAELR